LCVKFFALWCKFNEKNRANKNLLNRNWLFKKGHWLKAIGICKRFWLHLKKNKRVIFHWCVIIDCSGDSCEDRIVYNYSIHKQPNYEAVINYNINFVGKLILFSMCMANIFLQGIMFLFFIFFSLLQLV